MKNNHSIALHAALIALAFSVQIAIGNEGLLNENFDSINLEALQPGWTKAVPTALSIIAEDGHGKVLKISNSGEKYPFLMVALDPAKVAGKSVNVMIASKFPGTYVPIADKLSASPKVILEAKDAAGVVQAHGEIVPQAGKPEWQDKSTSAVIPANMASVTVQICVQFVTCDVFFDNLVIDMDAAPAPAPAVATPAQPAPPVNPANPATPAANDPASIAAKAPKRTLDDGGMTFGPDYVLKLQPTAAKKTANPGTALFCGPGFSEKDAPIKLQAAWKVVPVNAKLVGGPAAPRALLATLAETLAKEKPEVVFISSDLAPGRKASSTESDDWLDLTELCKRYGAVPVIVPHSNDTKDEQFDHITQGVKQAETVGTVVTVAPNPPDLFVKRARALLGLLETHLFLRAKLDNTGKPANTAGKPVDE